MNIKPIKTDKGLLKQLEHGAERKLTPEESREQRVSFVYGAMKSDSSVTREQVKKALEHEPA